MESSICSSNPYFIEDSLPLNVTNNIIQQIKSERRWFYKAQLIYLYHHAMQQEFGSTRGKKWTISDTSSALELSAGYVSESIKLVKQYENKELGQMTREEALRLIK